MYVRTSSNFQSDLPTISEYKHVKDEVVRLIKNKIQPLTYKQYVLKSGRWANGVETGNASLNLKKPQQLSKEKSKIRLRKTEHKENSKSVMKKGKNLRRKAIVQVQSSVFDRAYFMELQSKVQKHIMLKKMDIMENQYTYAEQCGKKYKQEIYHRLGSTPLEKYLKIFQRAERPSEKIHRVDETSCSQMLQQIKSAKSIKYIECIEENMKHLVNIENKEARNPRVKKEYAEVTYTDLKLKKENRKLRNEIMEDIHKQYENQASSKIRISINNKKMIQIL